MKDLNQLKKEEKLLKELISVYEQLEKLKELTDEEKLEYQIAKDKLKNITTTVHNMEAKIEYTTEEMSVFALPEDEQEKAWFQLFKTCDFSKDSILRICSMLKSDGLIPVFKSSGITISKQTAHKAADILRKRGIECLSESTNRKLFEVKEKIKNGETLTADELIYKDFIEKYDDSESGHLSGKCMMTVYNYFASELNKRYKKTGTLEDRADYLIDRVTMALYFGGKLASGEKEFIALYFKDKKGV